MRASTSERDQGQPRFGVMAAVEVLRRFDDDDLEGGADGAFHEVTAAGGAVGAADDDVDVDLGLSLLVEGDVADEGEDLDLLVDRDLLVLLALPVEVAEGGAAE